MKTIILALAAMTIIAAAARSEEVIKEGEGWNHVLVNASGEETAKLLKGRDYVIVIPNVVFNCLVNKDGTVTEVRLNKDQELGAPQAAWQNPVQVNAPGEEAAKLLKGQNYLIVLPDANVNCLVYGDGKVREVRFNKGFNGATGKGIRIGSTEQELIAAYGNPEQTVTRTATSKKLIYPSKLGMLFWLADGQVIQIVVYSDKGLFTGTPPARRL
ncbi:MAG: hypothetical protein WCV67_14360 [Victivallaceae bacterium]